jgi:hypothetical protein
VRVVNDGEAVEVDSLIAGYDIRTGLLPEQGQEEGIVRGSVDAPAGFQLRIELREVLPPVWRRFLVPGSITLSGLHRVIQEVTGGASLASYKHVCISERTEEVPDERHRSRVPVHG